MLTAAIVGARGYLGRECARLLLDHPQVGSVVPVSLSTPEGTLGDSVPAFRGIEGLQMRAFEDAAVQEADVVFFATAGGQARSLVPQLPESTLVIDLSRDHRVAALEEQVQVLTTGETASGSTGADAAGAWVFGLTETPLAIEKGATRVANPGCYPTSALLGMAPLLQAGLLASGPLVVDGKSAVSGAGATPRPDLHFTATNDDVRAYKPVGHDHTEEMRLGARRLSGQGNGGRPVRFTPHLIPINRGLLTTAYLPLRPDVEESDVQDAYDAAYGSAKTVRVVDEARIANVRGTARAEVAWTLDRECRMIVVRSAIDNLLKGGSAQAIQNMNRALGFEETTGLPLIGGP